MLPAGILDPIAERCFQLDDDRVELVNPNPSTLTTEGPSWGYPSPALPRSWSHFVGNCDQKLTNLLEINF